MKKVNFKVVLMALSFAFSFLVLGVNRVEAQAGQTTVGAGSGTTASPTNYGKGVFALPTGNFVNDQEAEARLTSAIANLKNQLVQLPQGSFLYNATLRTWTYYNYVLEAVLADKTVAESIVIGLTKIAFTNDSSSVPTQSDLTTLRNSAINLLQ